LPDFSEREETVLRMLCQGRNKSEIAAKMFISEHTVKYYIVNIFDKTQSQTVVELIVKARNSQWIETIELRRRVNRA
jgi:DNA-binding CsgD family transcriptional regulator